MRAVNAFRPGPPAPAVGGARATKLIDPPTTSRGRLWQRFLSGLEGRVLLVHRRLPGDPPALVELRILPKRRRLSGAVIDVASVSQDLAAETVKLLVEQLRRLVHRHQPSKLRLIIEDVEKDGREPIQLFDLSGR
jgi:hypothetical protein